MARTLLQLVSQACNEIGISSPQFLFGNENDQEKQIIALANREGKEFSGVANKNGGWQELRRNYTFTTVPGQESYDLPPDIEYFVDKTTFDNKYKWSLVPINAQEQQILTYGVVASGPRPKYWIQGNKMHLNPIPQDSTLIAYQYYSKFWCMSADGNPQQYWMNDTDTYLLDEECFIQGLKWRFKNQKGFEYTQDFNDYERDVERTISRDGGSRDLRLNSIGFYTQFLNGNNVPDTGFGGQ